MAAAIDAGDENVPDHIVVGRCSLTLSNPVLKASGTKRLKLKRDEPLSNFAFNSNLRGYIVEGLPQMLGLEPEDTAVPAGAYTRSLFRST